MRDTTEADTVGVAWSPAQLSASRLWILTPSHPMFPYATVAPCSHMLTAHQTDMGHCPSPHQFFNFFVNFMYVHVYMCAWCPNKPEKDVGSPRTEVTDGCELLCGC